MEQLPDEKQIVERIRERLRTFPSRDLPPLSAPPPSPPDASPESIEADLEALRNAQDVYDQPLRSQRRPLGPALGVANRLARKLLKPSLERQVSYNAANERLVRALLVQVDALRAEIAALRDARRSG